MSRKAAVARISGAGSSLDITCTAVPLVSTHVHFSWCYHRYIAGKSCHGRFAGIYTMTFNSKSQYNNAKAQLQASVQGVGLNAYFSSNMQEFQGQYTSHSWATAEGWPNPDVPVTATPQDLWKAATGMDTSKGTPSGALLRPYSHLLDYLNAKDA